VALDDGALRFVRPDGEAVENSHSSCAQPRGDVHELPVGRFEESWRGERLDMDLAVDLLIQRTRKAGDVPAGTSPG
jgi:hypothetical protein